MMNNNDFLNSKIVELLTNQNTTRSDIARLLMQNDVDISDEDLEAINATIDRDLSEDTDDIKYQLSDDGLSFMAKVPEQKGTKELKQMFIRIPTKEEARFLEDLYYQVQDKRIALQGQIRSIMQDADSKSNIAKNNDNNMAFLIWLLENYKTTEENIKMALEAFSDRYYLSDWAKKNTGIGPVISTVLAANLDVKEGMHAGNFWSYCGLNDNNRPWLGREKSKQIVEQCIAENGGILDDNAVAAIAAKTKWKMAWLEGKAKGKKGWVKDDLIKACSYVPYNKHMKVLMFKIGHSFRMVKNKPESLYGRLLREREAYEMEKNANGEYAEQAYEKAKKVGKTTVAYKYYSKGQLPPAHIAQRAERYVTKIFMSHLFEAAYYNKFGVKCPEPYIIGFAENGHNDYIAPEVPYTAVPRDCDRFKD